VYRNESVWKKIFILFQSTWIWLSDACASIFLHTYTSTAHLLRKEVIQPHLPIRLPCYDFTPITNPTFGGALLTVKLPTSGVVSSHGVTGGVYKARERIHGSMLTCHY
jgi:hypothetical protein